jgi:hypothetical protein
MSNTDDRDDNNEGLLDDGHYVDGDQLSIFLHRDRDGNITENVGSRRQVSVTSTTDPWAAHHAAYFITKKLGNVVTLQIPSISYNQSSSNATIVYPGVVQSVDRPRTDKYQPVLMLDNNAAATGYVKIATDGSVTFQKTASTAFTGGTACGVYPGDVTWECKL